jgi:branched-chain amino acid aminotransferase
MLTLPDLAAVDGRLMPRTEAVIAATDEGLLRGDGAFEVARLYDGVPFAWEDHILRLERSCEALRLTLDRDALDREARALLEQVGPIEALLRVVITRAGRRLLLLEPPKPIRESVRLATVLHEPTPLLLGVKSLSYAANMLATRLAHERGYDEALFVNREDTVLEGPTFAFFWVEEGRIYVPPLEEGILDSITRRRVLESNDVIQEHATLDRLRERADEAFVAGTSFEVAPVLAIENVREWAKPGPVTLQAIDRTGDLIRSEISQLASAP